MLKFRGPRYFYWGIMRLQAEQTLTESDRRVLKIGLDERMMEAHRGLKARDCQRLDNKEQNSCKINVVVSSIDLP
jgi:hypothetical protein